MPYNVATMSLPLEGVFACGEMVTGPGAAVEAVADGHRAATAVIHYLETGELLEVPERELLSLGELPEQTAERVKPLSPVQVRVLPTEERIRSFIEIEEGFTEAEARAEARRCLACTTGAFVDEERCVGCLTCVRICPFGVATVEKTAVIPQDQCLACGLCAAQCPAAAIALKRFGTNKMKEEVAARLQETAPGGRSRPLLVSYCCLFEVTSRRFVAREDSPEGEGVVRVMVPCVGRLSVVDLLAPFELGADGVVVISLVLDQTGRLREDPEILTRGFIYKHEADDLLDDLRERISKTVRRCEGNLHDETVQTVRSFLYNETKRRPQVFVTLNWV